MSAGRPAYGDHGIGADQGRTSAKPAPSPELAPVTTATRPWPGWYHHITLAVPAHAFLTVTRAGTREVEDGDLAAPARPVGELIPLTLPEVRRPARRDHLGTRALPESLAHRRVVLVEDLLVVVVLVILVVVVLVEFDVVDRAGAPHLVGASREPSAPGGAVAVPAISPLVGQPFPPAPGARSSGAP